MKRCLLVMLAVIPLSAQIRITGLDGLAAKAKESVEITLDQSMLQLAGGFFAPGADANKAKDLISGLKSITVRTFEFAEEGQYKVEDLTAIRDQLRAPGWSKIVSVVEKGELTEVYTKTEQGKIAGLAVIAAESKELVVVAIDGNIDLASLAQLGGQFGIPNLPNLNQQKPNPQPKGKGK